MICEQALLLDILEKEELGDKPGQAETRDALKLTILRLESNTQEHTACCEKSPQSRYNKKHSKIQAIDFREVPQLRFWFMMEWPA
jgi:hypothetical protein